MCHSNYKYGKIKDNKHASEKLNILIHLSYKYNSNYRRSIILYCENDNR